MKRLFLFGLLFLFAATATAVEPTERCWGAGGKPTLKAPGAFPTSDSRAPVCDENADGGGCCLYELAPFRNMEDAAGVPIGADANITFVCDPTLTCSDDGSNKRRAAVKGSIATHDDATMATNGALTSANGGTMNAPLEEGTSGIEQDGNLRTLGSQKEVTLSFTMNAGPSYYKLTGEGPMAGATQGEKQDSAEMRGPGFTGIEAIYWVSKDSGDDPVNLSDDVTMGITIDNTDGSTLCTLASGNSNGKCDAGTPIPNRSATDANFYHIWVDSASVSGTVVDLDLIIRFY